MNYNYTIEDLNDINYIYDYLIENEIASKEAIDIVTYINGWSIDSLNDIIYVTTGNRDIKQLIQEIEGLEIA